MKFNSLFSIGPQLSNLYETETELTKMTTGIEQYFFKETKELTKKVKTGIKVQVQSYIIDHVLPQAEIIKLKAKITKAAEQANTEVTCSYQIKNTNIIKNRAYISDIARAYVKQEFPGFTVTVLDSLVNNSYIILKVGLSWS